MSVISIINQKGGCGKTTTSINLAATLAFKEKRVLLIDFDPQGHSTLGLGITEDKFSYSIYQVLTEGVPIDTALIPVNEKLTLLPSDIRLAALEQKLAGTDGRENVLKNKLEEIKGDYDFMIIDCPPHLGLLSVNALMASDRLIVPVEPSRYGLDGIKKLNQTISSLCNKVGHNIKAKYLISLFDIDSDFAHNFVKELKDKLGSDLFDTQIHRTSVVRESTHLGVSVVDHDQHSISFVDFMSLAHEVILWKNEDLIKQILADGKLEPQKTPIGICFMHKAGAAGSVQISGDFNNWDPERTPLSQINGDGLWYTILPLDEGIHKYQYVVDGEFKTDPENPNVETSLFGASHSVLAV
ncbi:AAA family ATPase [Candidatus Margulisiibacteriota bacterium]